MFPDLDLTVNARVTVAFNGPYTLLIGFKLTGVERRLRSR